jgi:prepilin-type N-terminal cleavage/methylation domain-containing protein
MKSPIANLHLNRCTGWCSSRRAIDNRQSTIDNRPWQSTTDNRRAFTLIEIMVVVAIIGIIAAAGVPTLYKMLHKEGFRKTLSDVLEVCQAARSQAIIEGKTMVVEFRPQDRTCILTGAGDTGGLSHSAHIDDSVVIEMLDVNLREYRNEDVARVRFRPNGTSDEMTLILQSDKGEQRGIRLEITTAIASVLNERELQDLRSGKR